MVDYTHPVWTNQPVKVSFVRKDGPSAAAGIQPGDLITRVGNVQDPTWEDLRLSTVLGTREQINMEVNRNGQLLNFTVKPDAPGQAENDFGIVPIQPLEITVVDETKPLYQAGGREGDLITAVDGRHFDSVAQLQDYLSQSSGAPVSLTLLRNGKQIDLTVKPVMSDDGGPKRYRLGFGSEPVIHDKLSFARAVSASIDQNKKFAFLIVEMIQKMVEQKVSMKQLDGPVRIAQLSGQAARAPGWVPLMLLMAAISLNLGILNLMPIPILDGGLILLTAIESVIRRDIDQRVKERIYQTAFVFLVMFAVAVVYNDVHKMLFPKYLQ
jgi:regulator of sigma E protease